MLAKLARVVPTGEGWLYEPKWDGFRCIVTRDGDDLTLSSRNERPLDRYFPELRTALLAALPRRCVVDGEIVVPHAAGRGLDFDALQQRIHPAASRVRMLAEQTPASFVAFDLIGIDDTDLTAAPFVDRRAELVRSIHPTATVHVTPATTDPVVAAEWFDRFEGAGLDGVIAKPLDAPYTPDRRTLVKVKHERSADCVVAGYRMHADGAGVGSLLLGLHEGTSGDAPGRLHHVGVCASFTAPFRRRLLDEVAPLAVDALDGHPWHDRVGPDGPSGTSRWNAGKDLSFVPLRPERVVEVAFGQLENGRFRHGVSFRRWRPDRRPDTCRFDQLDVAEPVPFLDLVGRPTPR